MYPVTVLDRQIKPRQTKNEIIYNKILSKMACIRLGTSSIILKKKLAKLVQ